MNKLKAGLPLGKHKKPTQWRNVIMVNKAMSENGARGAVMAVYEHNFSHLGAWSGRYHARYDADKGTVELTTPSRATSQPHQHVLRHNHTNPCYFTSISRHATSLTHQPVLYHSQTNPCYVTTTSTRATSQTNQRVQHHKLITTN